MDTPTPIVVTGATGRLGGRVARLLADRGVPQRLAVRSPERAPQLPGADVLRCDSADGDLVRSALAGAEVDSHGDHRLAMALAVAGCSIPGVTVVRDAESATVTFPTFPDCMRRLGADLQCVE